MTTAIDLTGQRFGRLTAVRRLGPAPKGGRVQWVCRCACGGETIACSGRLRSGAKRSCGCLQDEKQARYYGRVRHNSTMRRVPVDDYVGGLEELADTVKT
jgi:hypothetical protein